jgi:hypothetical protein
MVAQLGARILSIAFASIRSARLPAHISTAFASGRTAVVLWGPRLRSVLVRLAPLAKVIAECNKVLLAFSLTPLLGKRSNRTDSTRSTEKQLEAATEGVELTMSLLWMVLPLLLPLLAVLVWRLCVRPLARRPEEATASTPPARHTAPRALTTTSAAPRLFAVMAASSSPHGPAARTPPRRSKKAGAGGVAVTTPVTTPVTPPVTTRHAAARMHRDQIYSQAAAAVAELRRTSPPTRGPHPSVVKEPSVGLEVAAKEAEAAAAEAASAEAAAAEAASAEAAVEDDGDAGEAALTQGLLGAKLMGLHGLLAVEMELPTAETETAGPGEVVVVAEEEEPTAKGKVQTLIDEARAEVGATQHVETPAAAPVPVPVPVPVGAMAPCLSPPTDVPKVKAEEDDVQPSVALTPLPGLEREKLATRRPTPSTSSATISSVSSETSSPTMASTAASQEVFVGSAATMLTRRNSSASSSFDGGSVMGDEGLLLGRKSARRSLSMHSGSEGGSPSERAQAIHERALRREQLIRTSMKRSNHLERSRGAA